MYKKTVEELQAGIFKAMGHPTRIKLIAMLAQGPKCVCELVDKLTYDQSTISRHLAVLKNAGIVDCTKEGLKVIYELQFKCVYEFMKCIECSTQQEQERERCGLENCNLCGGEKGIEN